jgi:hypothetical protein
MREDGKTIGIKATIQKETTAQTTGKGPINNLPRITIEASNPKPNQWWSNTSAKKKTAMIVIDGYFHYNLNARNLKLDQNSSV